MKSKRPLADRNSLEHTIGSCESSRLNLTEGLSHFKQPNACLTTLLKQWTTESHAIGKVYDASAPLSARYKKPPVNSNRTNEKDGQNAKEKLRSHTPSGKLIGSASGQATALDFGSEALFKGSLDNYSFGRQLGQGAYATVKLCLQKSSNSRVAVKIYDKSKMLDPHRRRNVRREIEIMHQIDHENCVKLVEAINSPKHIFIVMEYVGGGSLHGCLKQKPLRQMEEKEARKVFEEIVQGVQYCHAHNIAHRDLKLENILLTDSHQVKIIDFGFSTLNAPNQKAKMFCGTPSYMAPEIVARKEYSGTAADIWALGVLLYAMLIGSFPFRGISDKDLYAKIMQGHVEVSGDVSPLARALIHKMLSMDPTRRPTCAEILKHAWVSSENPSPVFTGKDSNSQSSSTRTQDLSNTLTRVLDTSYRPSGIVAALYQKYHIEKKPGNLYGCSSHRPTPGQSRSSSRQRGGKEN